MTQNELNKSEQLSYLFLHQPPSRSTNLTQRSHMCTKVLIKYLTIAFCLMPSLYVKASVKDILNSNLIVVLGLGMGGVVFYCFKKKKMFKKLLNCSCLLWRGVGVRFFFSPLLPLLVLSRRWMDAPTHPTAPDLCCLLHHFHIAQVCNPIICKTPLRARI